MMPVVTCAYVRHRCRGDEGTRTLNPRRAKAVLFQLSYVPSSRRGKRGQARAQ